MWGDVLVPINNNVWRIKGFRDVHAAVQFNLAFALHSSTSNSSSENLVGYLLDVITGAVEDETALGLGGTLGAICRAGVQAKYMKKILKCLRGDDACANPIPKNEQRYKAQCRSVLHALEVRYIVRGRLKKCCCCCFILSAVIAIHPHVFPPLG